jgi:tight adherence protein C
MIDPDIAAVAVVCCCGVALRGVTLVRSQTAIERRELRPGYFDREHRRGPTRQLLDLLGARLGPVLLARVGSQRREQIQRRLDLAGGPAGMNLRRYAEIKAAVLAIGLALAVLFLLIGSWFVALLCLAVSWIGLDYWLSRTGRMRQSRIERDFPDFVDILAITVRAGTGYRAALDRVSASLSGPASEEIVKTLHQIDLGASRREAFEALRRRNANTTLDSFVGAQLQAEELGVPLADALTTIAADTRRVAAQLARRRAQRAAPRITLISAMLLMPATILLIAVGLFIGSGVSFSHIL